LSPLGENLIIGFEVGGRAGYNQHPELPDRLKSGVTVAVGYDLHQVTPGAILSDLRALPDSAPARLAATHPFYGKNAVEPWHKVQDIVVPWMTAYEVFTKIDVAREWTRAERAMPGFDDLRPNAQAALISLGFNRGWSMVGDNRREMRAIRDAVPKKDYPEIASQLRKMIRVWTGTSIFNGMKRRRFAEAVLVETP
jgi:GH24 family phage-related lysozyme (muramidase)